MSLEKWGCDVDVTDFRTFSNAIACHHTTNIFNPYFSLLLWIGSRSRGLITEWFVARTTKITLDPIRVPFFTTWVPWQIVHSKCPFEYLVSWTSLRSLIKSDLNLLHSIVVITSSNFDSFNLGKRLKISSFDIYPTSQTNVLFTVIIDIFDGEYANSV